MLTESQVVNEWIEKACADTQLKDARAFVKRVLRRRFGDALPSEVLETINAQPSTELLEDWFDAALGAASLQEFLAVLRR